MSLFIQKLYRNIDGISLCEKNPEEVIFKQGCDVTGVYLILEGQCEVQCDLEALIKSDPWLTTDNRQPDFNLDSLKKSLEKKIIPHKFDHDMEQRFQRVPMSHDKMKIIRILQEGDMIGDIEVGLKLPQYIFTIKNSKDNNIKLLFVPSVGLPKFLRQTGISNTNFLNIIELKCETYLKQKVLVVLFYNLLTLTFKQRKPEIKKKPEKTDFRATLQLYQKYNTQLVPSHIPESMRLMLKMRQKQEFWDRRIEVRNQEMEEEKDRRVNFYRSFHQHEARSRKHLEGMKLTETEEAVTTNHDDKAFQRRPSSVTRPELLSSQKIPINHPAISSIWLVMKAVTKFKTFSETLQNRKIARSKEQLQKCVKSYSKLKNQKGKKDEQDDELEFDKETGDKHIEQMEKQIKRFIDSIHGDLVQQEDLSSINTNITPLSKFSVKNNTIPQVGGTILVRFRPCSEITIDDVNDDNDDMNPGGHIHMRHHILPRDTLTTLQKYRSHKH